MPNRYLCSVLEECRAVLKHTNHITLSRSKKTMLSLIEEIQMLGNRMEASLYDANDYKYMRDKRQKLKTEIDELKKELKVLKAVAKSTTEEEDVSVSRIHKLMDKDDD